MQASQVTTSGDFRAFMLWLAKQAASAYAGSLEQYLCALLLLIDQHQHQPVSWRLLAELFSTALTSTPIAFDDRWFVYDSPHEMIRTHQMSKHGRYNELRQMLLYQIADLHRTEQAGYFTNEKMMLRLWMGAATSPTGQRWSNFFTWRAF